MKTTNLNNDVEETSVADIQETFDLRPPWFAVDRVIRLFGFGRLW
jgi:hypothetical protein